MSRRCLMIVDPGVQLWGSERALAATLSALAEEWGRLLLITPPGAALADVARNGAPNAVIEVKFAPIGYLHRKGRWARIAALLRLAILVAKHRPSRLYLNQAGLCRLMLPIARLARIPFVIHVRLLEDVERVASLRGRPDSPIHKIFISDAMLEGRVQWIDSDTSVYNAYDPYCFMGNGVASTSRIAPFVCVGRLSHSKGQHLLVEALALLAGDGAHTDFFGEGVEGDDYAAKLSARAVELHLGGRVTFHGFCRDVTARLAGYRFLVSTSRYETLGRVVMEAWDAGLVPVVYAGSGGAAEIVRKSGAGILYHEWSPESLAAALRQAMQMSEEMRSSLALKGLKWGRENLGIDQYRAALDAALFSSKRK